MDRQVLGDRVVADVSVLAQAEMDLATFAEEAMRSLQRAVRHDAWSLCTVDPVSLMPTGVCLRGGAVTGSGEHDRVWARLEYGHDDPTSILGMVRASRCAVGVHDLLGDTDRSPRMRHLVSPVLGRTDELRGLASDGQRVWGACSLYRDAGHFEPWEIHLVEALCPPFAQAVRRAVLGLWAERPAVSDHDATAMLVLDGSGDVVLASPGGLERFVSLHLGSEELRQGLLVSFTAIAAATQATEGEHHPSTRLRLADGRWCTIYATPLRSEQADLVGLTISESRPRELWPLIVDALGMTPRERDVLALVVRGVDTRSVAAELHLSSHTVQDHLKTIFAKAGVHSRRELTALVLGDQLDPVPR